VGKVFFFNSTAKLREEPTIKNLLSVAKTNPAQAVVEINDWAAKLGNRFSSNEQRIWIVAYIMGVASGITEGTAAWAELTERLERFKQDREFFRVPYKIDPETQPPVSGTDDDGDPGPLIA
jgi:hypothetical protein